MVLASTHGDSTTSHVSAIGDFYGWGSFFFVISCGASVFFNGGSTAAAMVVFFARDTCHH